MVKHLKRLDLSDSTREIIRKWEKEAKKEEKRLIMISIISLGAFLIIEMIWLLPMYYPFLTSFGLDLLQSIAIFIFLAFFPRLLSNQPTKF